MALPVQQLSIRLRNIKALEEKILDTNYFMEKIFPLTHLRELSKEELAHYSEPFQSAKDRKPLVSYIQEVPWLTQNQATMDFIAQYANQLTQSTIPKLLLFAVPGFITTIDMVSWAKAHLTHLTLCDLGDAMHYAQETNPELMGKTLAVWYQSMSDLK